MTIINVTDIEYRKFSGWDEPQFPSGYWLGEGTVTGDATGGDMVAQIDFAKATGLRNSQYYSLERIMANQAGVGSGDAMDLQVANFGGFAPRYTLRLDADQALQSNLRLELAQAMYGLFLGQQEAPNSVMNLSFILDNVDTIVVTVKIEGYVWSARSTAVPGGPQRPPTGLYRN